MGQKFLVVVLCAFSSLTYSEMLNWLPYVEYNNSSKTYTTKDVYENAKSVEESKLTIRLIQKKRAIEIAVSDAINVKGDFDETILKKSLTESGFLECYDSVYNNIINGRLRFIEQKMTFRKKMDDYIKLGVVTQQQGDSLFKSVYGAEK